MEKNHFRHGPVLIFTRVRLAIMEKVTQPRKHRKTTVESWRISISLFIFIGAGRFLSWGDCSTHTNRPQQCIIEWQPSSALQILIGIVVKGRRVRNILLTVARGDDDIACIAIRLAYLFDLRIFLLRLSAQIAKIGLQWLDELLGLFRSRGATPHEWHLLWLSRFIGSYDDLQVYSLKYDVTDHHFTKFSYFALLRTTSECFRMNFTTHALRTGLSSVLSPIRGLIAAWFAELSFFLFCEQLFPCFFVFLVSATTPTFSESRYNFLSTWILNRLNIFYSSAKYHQIHLLCKRKTILSKYQWLSPITVTATARMKKNTSSSTGSSFWFHRHQGSATGFSTVSKIMFCMNHKLTNIIFSSNRFFEPSQASKGKRSPQCVRKGGPRSCPFFFFFRVFQCQWSSSA